MNKKSITTFHDRARKWTLRHGDVEAVLPMLPRSTFSGVLTDPPYGVGFMDHDWDMAIPRSDVWQKLLKVCKPGANLLAFGSPRTFHRLICNIEDAGWKIRDTLCWLHGGGFPKGLNVGKSIKKKFSDVSYSKSWNGHITALKPAWEPIVLAQKPMRGNYAVNAIRFGVSGLNIDECRVPIGGSDSQGRYPANVLLDDVAADELDCQAGTSKSRRGRVRIAGSNVGNGRTLNRFKTRKDVYQGYDDCGGRSRFFYCAKASANERQEYSHPTIKPLALCEWLARLILPPAGTMPRRLLTPYSGVASEMLGGLMAGWDQVTGIEIGQEHVLDARRRLMKYEPQPLAG